MTDMHEDPRSLRANPIIHTLYRPRGEPDEIHYMAADSHEELQHFVVHKGDPFYDLLDDRLQAFNERVDDLRNTQDDLTEE